MRGRWVDVSKGGTYRGETLSEAEREVLLAENAEFNRKMVATSRSSYP